jgi:hypothetical protein
MDSYPQRMHTALDTTDARGLDEFWPTRPVIRSASWWELHEQAIQVRRTSTDRGCTTCSTPDVGSGLTGS